MENAVTMYLVIGFDPVTFSMFTPMGFLDKKRAETYASFRRSDDKQAYFRIEEVPLDMEAPDGLFSFFEQ